MTDQYVGYKNLIRKATTHSVVNHSFEYAKVRYIHKMLKTCGHTWSVEYTACIDMFQRSIYRCIRMSLRLDTTIVKTLAGCSTLCSHRFQWYRWWSNFFEDFRKSLCINLQILMTFFIFFIGLAHSTAIIDFVKEVYKIYFWKNESRFQDFAWHRCSINVIWL